MCNTTIAFLNPTGGALVVSEEVPSEHTHVVADEILRIRSGVVLLSVGGVTFQIVNFEKSSSTPLYPIGFCLCD